MYRWLTSISTVALTGTLGVTLLAAWHLGASAQAPPRPQPQPPVPPAAQPAPPSVIGLWVDHTGRGAVQIAPCADRLCGHIAWLKDPNDEKGQPLRDLNNPVKAMRTQPICGLQILGDLKRTGAIWDYGWIYDPEKGERYDLEVRLKSPDVLQVTGYLGVKFLSETFYWKRVPEGQLACPPLPAGPAPALPPPAAPPKR